MLIINIKINNFYLNNNKINKNIYIYKYEIIYIMFIMYYKYIFYIYYIYIYIYLRFCETKI